MANNYWADYDEMDGIEDVLADEPEPEPEPEPVTEQEETGVVIMDEDTEEEVELVDLDAVDAKTALQGMTFPKKEDLGYGSFRIRNPDGSDSSFYARTKDDKIYATSSRLHNVVPWEWTESIVQKGEAEGWWDVHRERSRRTNYVAYLARDTVDRVGGHDITIGAAVTTSVDKTMANRIQGFILLDDDVGFTSKRLASYYHKHTQNVADNPDRIFQKVKQVVADMEKAGELFGAMANEDPEDWQDLMLSLSQGTKGAGLSKKMLPSYLDGWDELSGSAATRILPDTLLHVFRDIARNIWKANVNEQTRHKYMENLMKAFEGVAAVKAVFA